MQIELKLVWTDERDSFRFDAYVDGKHLGQFNTIDRALSVSGVQLLKAIQDSDQFCSIRAPMEGLLSQRDQHC